MGAPRLVLATRNPHKLAELARLLTPLRLELLAAGIALPPEDGDSFAAIALVKARAAARASGCPAIADDSGIEAAALGGAPGVRSARYAGEGSSERDNLLKLQREVPVGSALRYVCALAYVDPSAGLERVFEGCCEGTMAARARGSGGFGYDPVFVPLDDDGRTMAERSDDEKDAISHRGRAARALLEWLRG